jgi:UDP-2-acetamido-3-amino-2,3-dideoxy-glucuronate N-acetyltransferase
MRAHIFVSWLHPFKEQKLVVVGDKKMAVFDDTLPWSDKLLLYPHEINWEGNLPVPSKKAAERVSVPEAEPLRLECEQFLSCISNDHSPITDGQEGLDVLKILNAAQKSMDKGGCEIPLDGHPIGMIQAYPASMGDQPNEKSGFFSHSSVEIDANVKVGEGTKIWHFSHLLRNSTIGENCNIGQNVVIGPDVSIGDKCKIQNNVSVFKGVTLEDGVFCGPSMVFTNIYNPRAEISKMNQVRPTLVKKGATIGANATILCGVTIGEYAFIGAGAVVTKDVPANALMVGNPARQIGHVCQCGEKLSDNMYCQVCNRKIKS